jgi:hypothetical protein
MFNVKAFALTCGILWALAALVFAILAMQFSYGTALVNALGTVYIGYEATVTGALVGAVWGFVDAGIGGLVFAWLYNKLAS